MKTKKNKTRNFVSKYAGLFNKNIVMIDKKKRLATGYQKHKSEAKDG